MPHLRPRPQERPLQEVLWRAELYREGKTSIVRLDARWNPPPTTMTFHTLHIPFKFILLGMATPLPSIKGGVFAPAYLTLPDGQQLNLMSAEPEYYDAATGWKPTLGMIGSVICTRGGRIALTLRLLEPYAPGQYGAVHYFTVTNYAHKMVRVRQQNRIT